MSQNQSIITKEPGVSLQEKPIGRAMLAALLLPSLVVSVLLVAAIWAAHSEYALPIFVFGWCALAAFARHLLHKATRPARTDASRRDVQSDRMASFAAIRATLYSYEVARGRFTELLKTVAAQMCDSSLASAVWLVQFSPVSATVLTSVVHGENARLLRTARILDPGGVPVYLADALENLSHPLWNVALLDDCGPVADTVSLVVAKSGGMSACCALVVGHVSGHVADAAEKDCWLGLLADLSVLVLRVLREETRQSDEAELRRQYAKSRISEEKTRRINRIYQVIGLCGAGAMEGSTPGESMSKMVRAIINCAAMQGAWIVGGPSKGFRELAGPIGSLAHFSQKAGSLPYGLCRAISGVINRKYPEWSMAALADSGFPGGSAAFLPIMVEEEGVACLVLHMVHENALDPGVCDMLVKMVSAMELALRENTKRQSLRKMTELAYRDGLTQLPNRTLFMKRAGEMIEEARIRQMPLAMYFMDLDGFKQINDRLGHHAGDELLRQFAMRLGTLVREKDVVARLGGDEFVMLVANTDRFGAKGIAHRVIDEAKRPFVLEGETLCIGASVGVAFFPDEATELEGLMRRADMAMYLAKQQGRSSPAFFPGS